MDEIKRFLRFTLPGLVFIIQLTLIILFTCINGFCKYDICILLFDTKLPNLIALFAGLIVIAAAVGYLLAQLYWGLYWKGWFSKRSPTSHRRMLLDLEAQKGDKFRILNAGGQEVEIANLDVNDCWSLVTQYFSTCNYPKIIKRLTVMDSRLVDMTHSIGTTMIGNYLLLIGTVLFTLYMVFILFFLINLYPQMIIINIIIIAFLYLSNRLMRIAYKRTQTAHQALTNSTFVQLINEDIRKSTSNSVVLYYEE